MSNNFINESIESYMKYLSSTLLNNTRNIYWSELWLQIKNNDVPITIMSSDEIYALFDKTKSDDKEHIENLMNNLDTKFIDEWLIENGGSKVIFPFQQAVSILKTIQVIPMHQYQLKQWYEVLNLTLILMTMFHLVVCKFPKLIKNAGGESNSQKCMWKNVSLQEMI